MTHLWSATQTHLCNHLIYNGSMRGVRRGVFTVDRVDLQFKQFTSWDYNEHAASTVCTEPRCQGWMGRKYRGREACWSGGLEQSIAVYFSAIRRHSGLEKVALIGSIVEQQWAEAQGLERCVRKGLVPHLRHKHVCVENHS